MKEKFYLDVKEKLNNENLSEEKYSSLVDDYIATTGCKADKCNNLKSIKSGLKYIIRRYKSLLKLQKQNEHIFSQILHDIKSPMLGIKYALEGVNRNEIEEEIYNINLSILRIIQDFLLLYSFKYGFKTLDFNRIYPFDIAQKEYKLYAPIFRYKHIGINFKNNSNPCIISHEAIFSRIVSNLISNAIKYAPVNSDIEVEFCENPQSVVFMVSNLIDKDIKKDENSFGMGLLISKRLARRIKSTLCMIKSKEKIIFELKMPKIDHPNHAR